MAQMIARCPSTAFEARLMLQKIKMDNMRRCQEISASPRPSSPAASAVRSPAAAATSMARSAVSATAAACHAAVETRARQLEVPFLNSLAPNNLVQVDPNEMGSFTSKSIVRPTTENLDDDVSFEGIDDVTGLTKLCADNLRGFPEPIKRSWRRINSSSNCGSAGGGKRTSSASATAAATAASVGSTAAVGQQLGSGRKNSCSLFESSVAAGETPSATENVRLLQWNALSQTLGTKNDNFVKCPKSALDWRTRRFRMLEEIAQYDADVICLQEVDHFRFFQRALASLNYQGHFFPKPDSPCIYLPENSGPDGCAIFFKKDKFSLQKLESRVIEVWRVQSNQVVLSAILRSKLTGNELMVATTHLKARSGTLLSTLRNEQGKDLLQYLKQEAGDRPIIISGDFNAEPTEPVYNTMIEGIDDIRFQSAYAEANGGVEVPYTTWKIREDGEHIQTLDYVFHTPEDVQVEAVLDFPSGDEIGLDRLPSHSYASDHFSLACDFKVSGKRRSTRLANNQDQKSKH